MKTEKIRVLKEASSTSNRRQNQEMSRRVVVTVIGLVSSLGIGTEANWTASAKVQRRRAHHQFDATVFSRALRAK